MRFVKVGAKESVTARHVPTHKRPRTVKLAVVGSVSKQSKIFNEI